MPFTDFIDQLELIPLDGNDLLVMSAKLGNPDCRFMLYDELNGVSSIDELFVDGNNTMYILLQIDRGAQDPIGHWVSIIKHSDSPKSLENVRADSNSLRVESRRINYDYSHYDSYGFSLDQELSFTHTKPLLQSLLSGVSLEESRNQHQKFKDKRHDVNTCGRHTVTRSVFYYLSNKEYDKLIIQPILKDHDVRNPDVMVSLLTGFLPPNDSPVQQFFMKKAIDINQGSVSRGTPF